LRTDVAEQAAVLIGAVLLVLGIERAPLAQDGEAEEYEQTDDPPVPRLFPSRHASPIIYGMNTDAPGMRFFLGQGALIG
jgi:hypothetical protein